MASDTRQRHVAAAACLALTLLASVVCAQESADRVTFRVSDECSSGESGDTLREAIAVRLGRDMQLVESPQSYSVSWTSTDSGCRLLVETPSTTTPVSLTATADPDAIRNAASRAVWLLANAEPQNLPAQPPPRRLEDTSDDASEAEGEDASEAEGERAPTVEAREPGASSPPAPEPEPGDGGDATEAEPDAGAESSDEDDDASVESNADDREDAEVVSTPPLQGPSEPGELQAETVNVRLGIFPGIGAPLGPGPHVSRMAFNIFGWQAGVRELEIGLLANVDTQFVEGAQFAGLANVSLGRTDGFALAGATNVSAGVHNGQQIAGVFNYADRLDGMQMSPVNMTNAAMAGAQLGAVNIAGSARGLQFGLVNIGRRVEGLQLGVFNIAADSDYSLGLLNVNYQRPLHVDVWATELGANFVGLRHGSRYVQWILATGWRPSGSDSRSMWSTGVGLGVHMPLDAEERFFLESDLIDYLVVAPDPNSSEVAVGNHLQFRLDVGWRLAKRFALFGGASLNLLFSDSTQTGAVTLNGPLVFESGVESNLTALWPGFQAGMRF